MLVAVAEKVACSLPALILARTAHAASAVVALAIIDLLLARGCKGLVLVPPSWRAGTA
jgi:ABC-type sugar transport system substrate-binding protein